MALCSSFKLGKPLSFWSVLHLHRAREKFKQQKPNRTDMMGKGKGHQKPSGYHGFSLKQLQNDIKHQQIPQKNRL